MALDAEGAEHDAERQVHATRAPAPARCAARGRRPRSRAASARRARGRGRRRARASASGSATPSRSVSCAQLVLVGHRAGRGGRAEERAAEARALLVGPVDEPDGDAAASLPRRSAAAPRRRRGRSGSRRASRRSAPSRCARRSARRAPSSPRSVNHWLPASSTSYLERQAGELVARATRAPRPRSPSTRPAARRSRRRSARAAPRARRRCGWIERHGREPTHADRPCSRRSCVRDAVQACREPALRARADARARDSDASARARRRLRLGALGGLPRALDGDRLDAAVRRRRHDDAAHAHDRRRALRAARRGGSRS